jgi:hypothetical protein
MPVIKPVWFLSAFAAGVVVGALAMRSLYGPSAAPGAGAMSEPAAPAAPAVAANDSPESRAPEATRAETFAAAAAAADVAAAARPSASLQPPAAMPDPAASGFIQPIDAGEAFNKMLARPSQPGFENQIGDAHRALEREMRDEGWAHSMEAELQNAMINEVSMGAFKAEHIECRATMCEVRLSGAGSQAAALKVWHDSFIGQGQSPTQRLFLRYGSSVSNNEQTDMLMIFQKPPPPEPTPQSAPPQPVKKIQKVVARQAGA